MDESPSHSPAKAAENQECRSRYEWSGWPKQGILFDKSDVYRIPFSIVFLSGVSYVAYQFFSASTVLGIVGIPFILFGLFIAIGRFIVDANNRNNLEYFIDESGIHIIRNDPQTNVMVTEIVAYDQWTFTEVIKYSDGTGTVKFVSITSPYEMPIISLVPTWSKIPQLFRIKDIDMVLSIIEKREKKESSG